jgi:hypothetical protein
MKELWIPEFLIALFLLLPLIRPFIKGLRPQNGLIWLPPLALIIAAGLFPAYGFRPECIPLLIFTVLLNILNIPFLITSLGSPQGPGFSEGRTVFTLLAIILLTAVTGTALYFAPFKDIALDAGGIRAVTVRDEKLNREFFLRIYDSDNREPRPLLFLIPPVIGSVMVVDGVCAELRERGLTVLTYSRAGFDSPAIGTGGKKHGVFIGENIRTFRTFFKGTVSLKANARGRFLEEERKADVEFLLSYIRKNPRLEEGNPLFPGSGPDTIFLAGYDAGGGALILLGNSLNFVKNNPSVKGIIAVESRLLSSYRGEERDYGTLPENSGWPRKVWFEIKKQVAELKPKKIAGLGQVPRSEIPLLILVSDRILNPRYRDGEYAALLNALHNAQAPAVLAAVNGAGPLDYSDYPVIYPLVSFLYPGEKKAAWKNTDFVARTASLMSNFAALLMEKASPAGDEPRSVPPRRINFANQLHLETQAWNLPDLGYILGS